MTKQNQTLAIIRFAWNSRWKHILVVVVVTIITFVVAMQCRESPVQQENPGSAAATNERISSHWTVLDRVVTVSTLVVATAVWFGEVREEWVRKLPRRLFAYFLFEDNVVAVCLGANIGGLHDARALGQQIGAQMFAEPESSTPAQPADGKQPTRRINKQLRFDITAIELEELKTVVTPNSAFKPISIVFRLLDKEAMEDVNLGEGKSLLWIPRQGAPETVDQGSPRCQIPKDVLPPAVIDAVIITA